VRLETVKITQDFGDVVNRPRLDLVHESAVAAVPSLRVETDGPLFQDIKDLTDLLFTDDLTEPNSICVGYRNHDLAIGVQDAEHVKPLRSAGDVFFVNAYDFRHTLSWVYGFVSDLEFRFCLHDFSFVTRRKDQVPSVGHLVFRDARVANSHRYRTLAIA